MQIGTVHVILGTRPEAIKLAPVILALKAVKGLECRVCATGQHRQMLGQVFDTFGLVPDADLDLMQPNQTLGSFTARAIQSVDSYLAKERPDLVLVQGDTTTVLCASLAAFYQRIRVGHVEAGLRTGDMQAPWPEEANRILTSRLANIHFAPTQTARQNLLREGVSPKSIVVTGNTVIDALFLALGFAKDSPPVIDGLPDFLQPGPVKNSGYPPLVLITGHRRENFGGGFEQICSAIAELADRFPNVQFVYPVHLNPNVRRPVLRVLAGAESTAISGEETTVLRSRRPNLHLIEPLGYLPFVALMNRATLILTDSGGVQEEAPSLGKPVLVMRDTTERPEAVAAGTVALVGTDKTKIISGVTRLLTDSNSYERMARAHNPYGDGQASGRIVQACLQLLQKAPRG
jgi:UDP-N-acetylglucosamine 2-epimerase (non-hydrolysing)